jgi:DNA-binding NarL/FixJ family response regulator
MKIRVLIADDHSVVAESLRYMLEAQPDIEVVGCVANGNEAVRACIDQRPDIVLMDYAMPGLDGTDATRLIGERLPGIRVIMLSMYADPMHVCRALRAGASAYVVKKSAAAEVVNAVRTVHGGRRYLSTSLVETTIDALLSDTQDPFDRLSARERQVLKMLAEGAGVAQIAAVLSLSPKTVETYRARLMEKLEIHDLASLVKLAIQRGLITLD